MESKMAAAKNFITLPHGHLYPKFFPKDFKGKIIFIQRDPRAVAASAYPFLQKVKFIRILSLKIYQKSIEDITHEALL